MTETFLPEDPVSITTFPQWSYEIAFKRNLGLISEEEQQGLRRSCVAIAGMGGVGGVHLTTLARLGVGKFVIADPDTFDVANFNRQQGAKVSALGQNKAEAMAEQALAINPEIRIEVFSEAIGRHNIDRFLADADIYVDGLDFFAIDARRLVFREAAERGLWSMTAGPIGFSAAYLAFDPHGMSFDRYFDLNDAMDHNAMLAAFAVGLTPRMTHLSYTDLSFASLEEKTGPSAALACQLAAGALSADVLRILLDRGAPPAAPAYRQFDAYRNKFAKGRLLLGNRGPLQKIKRWAIRRRFAPKTSVELKPASTVDTLIHAFYKAPSGDNTQPWKCAYHEGAFHIEVDPSHDTSPMNRGQKMARIACGAGIENLVQTAVYNNACPVVELHNEPLQIAVVHCTGLDDSQCVGIPAAVQERYTNRTTYDQREVPSKALKKLQDTIADEYDTALTWVTERSWLRDIARFIGETDSRMFGRVKFLQAFLRQVHRGDNTTDGMPLNTLGLTIDDRLTLPLLKHTPASILHLLRPLTINKTARKAEHLVRSATGVVCVHSATEGPRSDVRVGRMMERVWLALTEFGFHVQPMMSYPVLQNSAPCLLEGLVDPFGADSPPAVIMRFGYGKATRGRTQRRLSL